MGCLSHVGSQSARGLTTCMLLLALPSLLLSGASLLSDRHSALHHCCIHPPLHLLIPPSSSAFIPLGLQGILETSPQRRPPPRPELSMFCDPILRKSSLFRVPYFMPCAIHFLHSCSLAPSHHCTESVSPFQSLLSWTSALADSLLHSTGHSSFLEPLFLSPVWIPSHSTFSCCSSNTAHLRVLPSACLFTPSHSLGLPHAYTKESVLIYDSMFRDFVCTVISAYATTSVSVFNCLCSLWAKQPTVGSAAVSYLLSQSTFSTSNITECGLRDLTVFALAHWQEHCSKTNP